MKQEAIAKRMILEAQELVEDILGTEYSQDYKDCMTAYATATLLNKVVKEHYPHHDVIQTVATILQTVPVTFASNQVKPQNAATSIFLTEVDYGGQTFYQLKKELHYGSEKMSTAKVPYLNILCHENNHLLNSFHEELQVTKTKGKKHDIVLVRTGLSKLVYMPQNETSVVENQILEEAFNEKESQATIQTIQALSHFDIKRLDIKRVLSHQDRTFQSPYQSTITYLRKLLPQIETSAQQARYFGSLNGFIRSFENQYQTSFKDVSKLVDQYYAISTNQPTLTKKKSM